MDDLRMLIKLKKIKMYALADEIGIGQDTLYRWMRKYNADHHEKILKAIEKLSGGEDEFDLSHIPTEILKAELIKRSN